MQVGEKNSQGEKTRSKGNPASHIFISSTLYHASLHHFYHFFHSTVLIYAKGMFSRGSPIFLQDPLKTYPKILYELRWPGKPIGSNPRAHGRFVRSLKFTLGSIQHLTSSTINILVLTIQNKKISVSTVSTSHEKREKKENI